MLITRSSTMTQPSALDLDRTLVERMRADATALHARVLAAAPRPWGAGGHARAVDYVVDQMRRAGWDVRVEELASDGRGGGRRLRNVVAERSGSAPAADRGLVVVGAHLDSVRGAPGANDNASGSATLIELARAFDGVPTQHDLRFVWFDGEEAGLLGSRAHVRANGADIERTRAMLNLDMVASPRGDVGVSLGPRTTTAVADALRGVMERSGVRGVVRTERHTRSDHASFDAVGIPSLDFGVSVRTIDRDDPNYHRPSDTLDRLNLDVLEGYGDLVAVTLLDLANRRERITGDAPRDVQIITGPPK